MIAALGCGLAGYLSGTAQATSLDRAHARTTQLADAQTVRDDLVAANATEINALLVGGVEPAAQHAAYDDAVRSTAKGLTRLASANPEDAGPIGAANAALPRYVGLMELARATNAQESRALFTSLDRASTVLRDDFAASIDTLVERNSLQASDDFSAAGNGWSYLAIGAVLIGVLIGCQVWLARRTRRVLNLGLVAATVLVAVSLGVGAVVLNSGSASASRVRDHSYPGALALTQAYAHANDAKSWESLALAKHGSGQTEEKAFDAAADSATGQLDDAAREGLITAAAGDELEAWLDSHASIRTLDDAGNWERAVALAVSRDAGSPAAAFTAFEQTSKGEAQDLTAHTQADLADAAHTARIAGWAMALAGLAAAALAWRGVAQRLKEYR